MSFTRTAIGPSGEKAVRVEGRAEKTRRGKILVIACAAALATSAAAAVEPRLDFAVPSGGTCGTRVKVELHGERLGDLRELVFFESGITLNTHEVVDSQRVRVVLDIAANCRIGRHAFRAVTRSGVSEVRTFHVSRFPSLREQEPNDSSNSPQQLQRNCTVDGALRENDLDRFAIELEAGRRFSAEVEGVRLGSMVEVQGQTLIDPVLELHDASGMLVARADDGGFAGRDPTLTCVVPRTGRYLLTVRDAVAAGSERNFYRLHVGDFSRPSVLYPAGGIAGERHQVRFISDDGSAISHAFDAPHGGDRILEMFAPTPTLAAVPNAFRVSGFPGIREQEPNGTFGDATRAADVAEFAFNGIIEQPGDVDCFRFTAKHSGTFNVRVYAKKLGSPLDTVVALYGARREKLIAENNDSEFMDDFDGPSTDSFLRVGVEAGKSYVLQIRGHRNSGGPQCVYRAEITPAAPWLGAFVREQSQYSQDRLAIAVPRGNRFLSMVGVRRGGFTGPLQLGVTDLPRGVRCVVADVPASVEAAPLVFEAAADAPLGAALSTVDVTYDGPPKIRGGLHQTITLSVGFPAYTPHCEFTTDKLVVVVVEKAPFRVVLTPPKVPLVRHGELKLQVTIEREPEFTGPVEVQLPFKPPGVGAYPSIIIPAGRSIGYYPLNADAAAELGIWRTGVMASALIDGGKLWIASQLVDLTVAEPYFDLTLRSASVAQGGRSSVECVVRPLQALPGSARLKLCGLPPGVSAPERELKADTTSLSFPIDCPRDAPQGRFDQVYCEATVMASGDAIVHNLGRGALLRIDPPSSAPAVVESAESPGLSRLERLRRSYAANPPLNGSASPAGPKATNSVAPKRSNPVPAELNVSDIATSGSAAASEPSVSFRRDVVPVLTKAGCNSGACHGSSRGKDGFRLSLLGYDPAADYYRLAREQPGRRIDVGRPAESLLLLKACGKVPHSGGALLTENSSHYKTLFRWLVAGAPDDDSAALPHLQPTRLSIEPDEVQLEQAGTERQFVVHAHYADGVRRDVTELVRYKSSDEGAASVSSDGRVTAKSRGETFITAALGTLMIGAEVTIAPKSSHKDSLQNIVATPSSIDLAVDAKLQKLGQEPSPPCDDAVFVRRVYLDLAGRLPTLAERRRFFDGSVSERRTQLIDRLLAAPEFVDVWTMRLSELLGLRSHPALPILGVSYKGTEAYYRALHDHVARNTPFDVLVRDLLTASGPSFARPEAHYYLYEQDPLNLAENTAQALLGVRLKCARCHNHPFDRWTMDDYYGFAAFFARVERKRSADPRERVVGPAAAGEVEHLMTKQAVPPRYLGGGAAVISGNDRRPALAAWLTAPENPWFARHTADLVWSHFFGSGLVEPIDDVRLTNPPSNAALRDLLAERLIAHRFDIRALMREICNSQTYGRSSIPNASNRGDERHLAHWPVRRLRAEVLLDAVCQVTDCSETLPRTAAGTRAVQLPDGATTTYFLSTFGRSPRRTVCACETNLEPTLAQSLHLLNGETIETKIREGGVVRKALAAGEDPKRILRDLYERTLARSLTNEEEAELLPLLAAAPDKQEFLEDLLWGLLNSREFTFHH